MSSLGGGGGGESSALRGGMAFSFNTASTATAASGTGDSGVSDATSGGGGGGGGVSISTASATRDKQQFELINSLKARLKELSVKFDNQSEVLAAAEKKNRSLTAKLNAVTEKDDVGRTARENFRLQSERVDLLSKVASLESMNDGLREELEQSRTALATERAEQQQIHQTVELAKRAEQKHKFNAGKWHREVLKSETQIQKQDSELKQLRDTLEQRMTRLQALEAESQVWERVRSDRATADAGYGRLHAHLLDVAKEASSKQHHLQNSLQATRQFLEELKVEYEEYSATSRAEYELYRRAKTAEYQKLKDEFDNYRRTQYDANQELLRHQQELVHALQHQFTEYRTTAETLFESEARALDDKLKSLNERHAHDLRLLVRTREQQFSAMVSSKDAKIMNLIEGTDYQKVLVRHHTEIAQLKDQHDIDIKKTRESAESDQRRLVVDLRRQVSDKLSAIDKLNSNLLHWKKMHEELIAKIAKMSDQHRIKEKSSHDTNERLGEELNQKTVQIEDLFHTVETLKHKNLRLRLQMEGNADDSIDSVIKRLSTESNKLRADISALNTHQTGHRTAHDKLQRDHSRAKSVVASLERELERRTTDYKQLTSAFEHFLRGRLKATATATPSATRRHNTIDGDGVSVLRAPFLDALQRYNQTLAGADGGAVGVSAPEKSDDPSLLMSPQPKATPHRRSMSTTSAAADLKTTSGGRPASGGGGALASPNLSAAGASPAAVGSSSRTHRMRSLITGITNMSMPAHLRPNSRLAGGAAMSSSGGVQPDVLQFDSVGLTGGGGGGGGALSSPGAGGDSPLRRHQLKSTFSVPVKLRSMMANRGALVDVDTIRELEHGFQVLEKFKSISRHYENDSKSKNGRRANRSGAAAGGGGDAGDADDGGGGDGDGDGGDGDDDGANAAQQRRQRAQRGGGGSEFDAAADLEARARIYEPASTSGNPNPNPNSKLNPNVSTSSIGYAATAHAAATAAAAAAAGGAANSRDRSRSDIEFGPTVTAAGGGGGLTTASIAASSGVPAPAPAPVPPSPTADGAANANATNSETTKPQSIESNSLPAAVVPASTVTAAAPASDPATGLNSDSAGTAATAASSPPPKPFDSPPTGAGGSAFAPAQPRRTSMIAPAGATALLSAQSPAPATGVTLPVSAGFGSPPPGVPSDFVPPPLGLNSATATTNSVLSPTAASTVSSVLP